MQIAIPRGAKGLRGYAVEQTARGIFRGNVGVDVDVDLAIWRLCTDTSQGFGVLCGRLSAPGPRDGASGEKVTFVGCFDEYLRM